MSIMTMRSRRRGLYSGSSFLLDHALADAGAAGIAHFQVLTARNRPHLIRKGHGCRYAAPSATSSPCHGWQPVSRNNSMASSIWGVSYIRRARCSICGRKGFDLLLAVVLAAMPSITFCISLMTRAYLSPSAAADPLNPEAPGVMPIFSKIFCQPFCACGANQLAGDVVAVLRVAAGVQHRPGAQAECLINKIGVHAGGAHHAQCRAHWRNIQSGWCQPGRRRHRSTSGSGRPRSFLRVFRPAARGSGPGSAHPCSAAG